MKKGLLVFGVVCILLFSTGGVMGSQSMDNFGNTEPLNDENTNPSSLNVRISENTSSSASAELRQNSPTKYSLGISHNSEETVTVYIPMDDTNLISEANETELIVNDETKEFELIEDELSKEWIGFTTNSTNPDIKMKPKTAGGFTGTLIGIHHYFEASPITIVLLLIIVSLGSIIVYQRIVRPKINNIQYIN